MSPLDNRRFQVLAQDLEPGLLREVCMSWVHKATREGKEFRIIGRGDPSAAVELAGRTVTR
jgi:hypothetical protein